MSMLKIRFGEFLLDEARYALFRSEQAVSLRPKVFDLLVHLVRNADRVVRREELVRVVWGDTRVGAGSLAGLVNELRRALGEQGRAESVIRTVHARGYQFVGRAVRDEASRVVGAGASEPVSVSEAGEGALDARVLEGVSHASAIGPVGVFVGPRGGAVALVRVAAGFASHGFELHRVPCRVGASIGPRRLSLAIVESLAAKRSREELAVALPLPARRWLETRSKRPVAGGRAVATGELPGGLTAAAAALAHCAGARPIVLALEAVHGDDDGMAEALAAFFRALGAAPVAVIVQPEYDGPATVLARRLVDGSGFRVFEACGDAGQGARRTLETWREAWAIESIPAPIEAALLGHLRGDRPLGSAMTDPAAATREGAIGLMQDMHVADAASSSTHPVESTRPRMRRVEPGARVRRLERDAR